MLFPIDVVIAAIYFSLMRTPHSASGNLHPWLAGALLCGAAWLFAELSCRSLRSHLRGLDGAGRQDALSGLGTFLRAVFLMAYIFLLEECGWPGALWGFARQSAVLDAAAGMLPYALMLALSWSPLWKLENEAAPGRYSRRQYISFRMRMTFFILVPWFILAMAGDIWARTAGEMWPDWERAADWLLSEYGGLGALFGLLALAPVVWLFPVALVWLWQCKRLPEGRLLDRLTELEKKAGASFSRVYVWGLGGRGFLNAAAVGFFPPCRYLFISRGLLEKLSEDELCGVVGHELGHVRHRHLLWYMFFTTAFASCASAVLEGSWWGREFTALALGGLLAFYLRVVFGAVSRTFEREADLFSLKVNGASGPLCASLEKIGSLAGNIRKAASWHHGSIAERVAFLQFAEQDAGAARWHRVKSTRIKLLGFGFSLLCFAFALDWTGGGAVSSANSNAGAGSGPAAGGSVAASGSFYAAGEAAEPGAEGGVVDGKPASGIGAAEGNAVYPPGANPWLEKQRRTLHWLRVEYLLGGDFAAERALALAAASPPQLPGVAPEQAGTAETAGTAENSGKTGKSVKTGNAEKAGAAGTAGDSGEAAAVAKNAKKEYRLGGRTAREWLSLAERRAANEAEREALKSLREELRKDE